MNCRSSITVLEQNGCYHIDITSVSIHIDLIFDRCSKCTFIYLLGFVTVLAQK